MGDCLNKVIRWPKNLLRRIPRATECQEPGVQPNSPTNSPHYVESGFCTPTTTFLDSMEELGSEQRHGRPYFYRNRRQRSERGPRMIGKSWVDRMSMDSVLTEKTKVYCAQRCLHDIDPKDILILRCLALGSSKYEQRSTWIINTLRGFMTREMTLWREERIKCVIRINGKKVCNACYAGAIGYPRSRLMNFIAEIRSTGRCTSVHGNTHRR
jgi:hypothetical protein